ncbi:NCK-associated protein 5 [Homalodisca vitripennis]|nr:NCK-associated protein 5 [Homalodisca vitripennis]
MARRTHISLFRRDRQGYVRPRETADMLSQLLASQLIFDQLLFVGSSAALPGAYRTPVAAADMCDRFPVSFNQLCLICGDVAIGNRVQQFQNTLSKLNQENEALKKQLHALEAAGAGEVQNALVERLRVLELDNSSLTRESELQRRQYERCLDDVANQVVRALLAQKALREEIGTLQQRVRDLETQNRTLTSLLLQQLTAATTTEQPRPKPSIKFALPAPGRPASCDDARLRRWEDSVVWLPLQRPTSLSLETCCQYRHRPVPQLGGKEEDEGSESPESGNRDEGYSTMSSDVQGLAEVPRRGLEELKEASDETDSGPLPLDTTSSSPDRLPEPDMVLIPLSLALSVGSAANRHSFPPVKELLPFQHVMRSFSDSHLCLKLAPSTAASSYSLASAESVVLLERHQSAPLHRARAAGSLLATTLLEEEDDSGSWCSGDWWDADYVQHWLRLDETRSALQQQMEYDTAELEDWSMEEEVWRREPLTHSQTLPSIQESTQAELEDDSSECLWNSSYLVDQLTVPDGDTGRVWPYNNRCLISPGGDSWSSAGTSEDGRSLNDCLNSGSKRSSTALSTDSGELPAVGTDFTRDFYRLVKFESTKSLASTSSRSQAGGDSFRRGDVPVSMPLSSDREQALQSVLHFIAEQQQYVLSREVLDTRPSEISLEEMSPDNSEEFSSKGTPGEAPQISDEVKISTVADSEAQNSLRKKRPLSSETFLNEYNASSQKNSEDLKSVPNDISCKKDIGTVKIPNGPTSEQDSQNESNVPLDKLRNKPELPEDESQSCVKNTQEKVKVTECFLDQNEQSTVISRSLRVDISRTGLRPVPEEDEDHPTMSESFTSTISTPETVLKVHSLPSSDLDLSGSLAESTDSTTVFCSDEPVLVNGPKTISFHERATSKDVIEELNRMIRKGEDNGEIETTNTATNLDMACCCPTGWVHVERDIDFTDPKARANLLDVMLAASHSSSSASSSSNSSSSSSSANNSDSGEEPPDYQHLHRLHRFRRQKKASATREPLGALRCSASTPRTSIIGRDDFFVRFGDKEREAVASFDFLEELSTTSVSGASSCDQPILTLTPRGDTSPSTDSERRHLSLSDSCAASFSGSEPSLDVQ